MFCQRLAGGAGCSYLKCVNNKNLIFSCGQGKWWYRCPQNCCKMKKWPLTGAASKESSKFMKSPLALFTTGAIRVCHMFFLWWRKTNFVVALAESRWLEYLCCCLVFAVERMEPLHKYLEKGRASKIPSPSGKCRTLGTLFVIVEEVFLCSKKQSCMRSFWLTLTVPFGPLRSLLNDDLIS